MTLQYDRQLKCVIGNDAEALDFADFRVTFYIRRGDYQNPNSADIRIYNLSDNTANLVQKEFTTVSLQAGYPGNIGQIFLGEIKQFRRGRIDQRDTYLDITAADGDRAYNYSTMALSLAAGATPNDHVQAFLQSMARFGITAGYLPPLSSNGSVRGKTFYGSTKDELRKFCQANKLKWSIQDGKLCLIPIGSYIPSSVVPVISPQTGLVGVPEQTQNGIEMRVLLNSSIKIGQRVQLDSSAINLLRYGLDNQSQATNITLSKSIKTNKDGMYYVMVANHQGDTRGAPWWTDLVCLAVDATVPVSLAEQAAVLPQSAILPVKLY